MRPTRATLATRVAMRVAMPGGRPRKLSFVPYNELYSMGVPDTMRGWAADYMSSRACFTRSGEDINGDGVANGPLTDTDCYTVSPDEPSLQVFPRGSQAVLFGTVEYRISGPFSIDYAAFVDVGSFVPLRRRRDAVPQHPSALTPGCRVSSGENRPGSLPQTVAETSRRSRRRSDEAAP
ncbi:MAG: BamA/TamA family outer membrane protein, partial [Deltaproteobacteria bacterium]|nr:BamA/TamA family outer membrane protein [Deltaproteobacteria bacterium]